MNTAVKSAFIRAIFLSTLLTLTACADMLPNWITGEPDEDIYKAPRTVGTPASRGKEEWPLLGNVPARPTDVTPHAQRKETIAILTNDKTDAETAAQRIEADAPTLAPPTAVATTSTASQTLQVPQAPAVAPPAPKQTQALPSPSPDASEHFLKVPQ